MHHNGSDDCFSDYEEETIDVDTAHGKLLKTLLKAL